jgi:photosystem II stability/assembly factor-like uncharacterized protein
MHVLPFSHRPTILAALAILTITAPNVVNSFHATAGLNQSAAGEQAASQFVCSDAVPTEFKISDTRVTWLCNLPEKEKYACPRVQFISGEEGRVCIGRKLWKIADSGATWQCIFDGGIDKFGDANDIFDFQFVSPDLGWVLTFEELRKTTDGGLTWRRLSNPLADGWLRSFKFLEDGKVGWVGGGLYKHLREDEGTANRFYAHDETHRGLFAAVFRTDDGWESWRRQPVCRSSGDISDFYFLNQDHGWAVGEAGDFYLNGGKWCQSGSCDSDAREEGDDLAEADDQEDSAVRCEQIAIGAPTFCPVAVWFVDNRVGWLSNSNGYVGKSTDGGATWADLVSVGAEDPTHCLPPGIDYWHFFDSSTAWELDSQGDLRTTSDGGASWTRLDLNLEFTHMYFLDATHGWAVSKDALFRITP